MLEVSVRARHALLPLSWTPPPSSPAPCLPPFLPPSLQGRRDPHHSGGPATPRAACTAHLAGAVRLQRRLPQRAAGVDQSVGSEPTYYVQIGVFLFWTPSAGMFADGVNHPTNHYGKPYGRTGNQHISFGIVASFDQAKPRLSRRPHSSNQRPQLPPLPPHHQKSMTVQLPQMQTLRPRRLRHLPSAALNSAHSWRSCPRYAAEGGRGGRGGGMSRNRG